MVAKVETLYVETVDTSYLETLVGYNARRAALFVIGNFMERMDVFDLRTVDFSVLSLIHHNAGITSRQLCSHLNLLAPNMVVMLNGLERRKLVERRPHPLDGRATGLHLTDKGQNLMQEAEAAAYQLEMDSTSRLSATERKTLVRLLQKIYK
jgi:DNA-binding MarR family transcriptional regulator